MPQVNVTVTEDEREAIKLYAQMDGRTMSNLMKKAVMEKIRRDRKKGPDGVIIRPPGVTA